MTTLLDIFMSDCFFMIDFTNSWIVHDILMQGKAFHSLNICTCFFTYFQYHRKYDNLRNINQVGFSLSNIFDIFDISRSGGCIHSCQGSIFIYINVIIIPKASFQMNITQPLFSLFWTAFSIFGISHRIWCESNV